jgi:hypothetical protein
MIAKTDPKKTAQQANIACGHPGGRSSDLGSQGRVALVGQFSCWPVSSHSAGRGTVTPGRPPTARIRAIGIPHSGASVADFHRLPFADNQRRFRHSLRRAQVPPSGFTGTLAAGGGQRNGERDDLVLDARVRLFIIHLGTGIWEFSAWLNHHDQSSSPIPRSGG